MKIDNINLANYKIFVDTCSFMYEGAPFFFAQFDKFLKSNSIMLYIPAKVGEELNKHAKSGDSVTSKAAKDGIKIVNSWSRPYLET